MKKINWNWISWFRGVHWNHWAWIELNCQYNGIAIMLRRWSLFWKLRCSIKRKAWEEDLLVSQVTSLRSNPPTNPLHRLHRLHRLHQLLRRGAPCRSAHPRATVKTATSGGLGLPLTIFYYQQRAMIYPRHSSTSGDIIHHRRLHHFLFSFSLSLVSFFGLF